MDERGSMGLLSRFWVLLISAVAVSMSLTVPISYAATDTVTVDVSVNALSEITVAPTALNFTLTPGSAASFVTVDIKNTGSNNVSNVYAYPDTILTEHARPYGSASSLSYSAGGTLVMRNQTNNTIYFAGRLEWNESSVPSNLVTNDVNSPVAWGFFRNTSYEYAWVVGNGTGTTPTNILCNDTGSQFGISDIADNGTTATRTPDASSVNFDAGDTSYGYFSVNRPSAPLYNSCVAVSSDCSRIYIYSYDKRSGFSSCANSKYLQGPALIPGSTHAINVSSYLPQGIPGIPGNLNTSVFTVSAS